MMFQNPIALDDQRTKTTKVRQITGFSHAADMHCCAVTVDEYERAARSLPIVFIKDNNGVWTSMCMLGMKQDVNLCVDADGNWAPNTYVPAWIRSYPFTFIRQDDNTLVPALEQAAFSLDPNEGTPLYNEAGEPTEFMNAALGFLKEYHEAQVRTRRFLMHMEKHELFEQIYADLKVGEESFRLAGIYRLDEAKIAKLPADVLAELMTTGIYRLIATHLMSLSNLDTLAALYKQRSNYSA